LENSRKRKAKKTAVVLCQGGNNAKRKIGAAELTGDCTGVLEQYPEGVLECAWDREVVYQHVNLMQYRLMIWALLK